MKKRGFITVIILMLSIAMLTGCAQTLDLADASLADSGTLILKVNPEISVEYNKEGLVTKITGLNDDGTAIVNEYNDYIGKDCRTVVSELVSKIGAAGYFVDDIDGNARNVTIEIEKGSVLPDDDFLKNIASDVHGIARGLNGSSKVHIYGDSDYGFTTYDATDYGLTDYDSDYGKTSTANKGTTDSAKKPSNPTNNGNSNYNNTNYDSNYGNSVYDNTNYGDSNY